MSEKVHCSLKVKCTYIMSVAFNDLKITILFIATISGTIYRPIYCHAGIGTNTWNSVPIFYSL